MSTPNELQNCPFCGDRVVLYHSHVAGEGDWIEHAGPSCGLEFSSLTPDETLADRWNKRADIEPLIRSHEVLREALEDLLATARSASWAHITNATKDDPCRCKGCSLKKAKSALAAAKEVGK